MISMHVNTRSVLSDFNRITETLGTSARFAVARTLNDMAFTVQQTARTRVLPDLFTLRNKYEQRSVVVTRAKPSRDIWRIYAEVGSTHGELAIQEEGFASSTSLLGPPSIPTPASAGGTTRRTKPVRKRFRRENLQLVELDKEYSSPAQTLVRLAQEAVATNPRRPFVAAVNNHPGVYAVKGGKKTTRGWPGKARLVMLYSLRDGEVRTAPHKWLASSLADLSEREVAEFWQRRIAEQLDRRRSK